MIYIFVTGIMGVIMNFSTLTFDFKPRPQDLKKKELKKQRAKEKEALLDN